MSGAVRAVGVAEGPGTGHQRFLAEVVGRYLAGLAAEGVPLEAELMVACVVVDLLALAEVPPPAALAALVGDGRGAVGR